MPAAARLEINVIAFAVRIEFLASGRELHSTVRRGLPVLRMEIHAVLRQSGDVLVVDIRIERTHRSGTLIGHGEARGFLVRHSEIAVQRANRRAVEKRGLVNHILAEIEAEEIAYRAFDAGLARAFP